MWEGAGPKVARPWRAQMLIIRTQKFQPSYNLDLPSIAAAEFQGLLSMNEILQFLPVWITRAGIPALSVIGFFWKGDEALSDDFKKWLSQKMLGVKLTVPNIAGIEPLGRIFDFIYGRRYFALTTFLRVAAVSLVALVVTSLVVAGGVAQGIAAFRAMPMDIDG